MDLSDLPTVRCQVPLWLLKGPPGTGGVRLAVDYRLINLHSLGYAASVGFDPKGWGQLVYVYVWDARAEYLQLGMNSAGFRLVEARIRCHRGGPS
jgi:hypothetical protein